MGGRAFAPFPCRESEHLKMSASDSCCCWPHPSCSLNWHLQTVLGASCVATDKTAERGCLPRCSPAQGAYRHRWQGQHITGLPLMPTRFSIAKEHVFLCNLHPIQQVQCESHNTRFIMYLTEVYPGFKKWRKSEGEHQPCGPMSLEHHLWQQLTSITQRWQWSK